MHVVYVDMMGMGQCQTPRKRVTEHPAKRIMLSAVDMRSSVLMYPMILSWSHPIITFMVMATPCNIHHQFVPTVSVGSMHKILLTMLAYSPIGSVILD